MRAFRCRTQYRHRLTEGRVVAQLVLTKAKTGTVYFRIHVNVVDCCSVQCRCNSFYHKSVIIITALITIIVIIIMTMMIIGRKSYANHCFRSIGNYY